MTIGNKNAVCHRFPDSLSLPPLAPSGLMLLNQQDTELVSQAIRCALARTSTATFTPFRVPEPCGDGHAQKSERPLPRKGGKASWAREARPPAGSRPLAAADGARDSQEAARPPPTSPTAGCASPDAAGSHAGLGGRPRAAWVRGRGGRRGRRRGGGAPGE